MGTYVNAEVVFGIVITESETDWDAPYVESDEDEAEIDYWTLCHEDEFSLLDYTYAGDSQWDDNPDVVYVKARAIRVDEDSVRAFEPDTLFEPSPDALAQLTAIRSRLDGKNITEPAWLLLWHRG